MDDDENKLSNHPFEDNINKIKKMLKDCPDIIMRKVNLDENKSGFFIYIDGMVNIDLIQRDFVAPLLCLSFEKMQDEETLRNLPVTDLRFTDDLSILIENVLLGSTVFIGEGLSRAIICGLISFDKRNIQEPITEKNIKGSHEGFVESIKTNMTILRRHVRNTNLKFKMFTIGKSTNQMCAVAYIEGIANPDLLKTLCEKIGDLNFDGFIGVGYIEQFINDHPNSPFPQYQATERPDKTTASLLEGRFAIMLDGTPVVSIVPTTFFSFFRAVDDFNSNWIFGTFIGSVRIFAALIAIFLPGLYISILSYHYYTVPLSLLIPLAESRSRVPFPPLIEALLMELTLELLRESTVRLPTFVVNSIGVVGGIIIGQAAVEAGLVSNLMVIVVAITAIASFVVPNSDMGLAIRVLRFIVMLFSAAFGVIGIEVTATTIMAHLVTLESLGQPYFQPLIPLKPKDFKDAVIRLHLQTMRKRPDVAQPLDKKRGSGGN